MEGFYCCSKCINIRGKIHFKITFFHFPPNSSLTEFFQLNDKFQVSGLQLALIFRIRGVTGSKFARRLYCVRGPLWYFAHIHENSELLLKKARLSLPSVQLLVYITPSFRSLTHTLIKGRLV